MDMIHSYINYEILTVFIMDNYYEIIILYYVFNKKQKNFNTNQTIRPHALCLQQQVPPTALSWFNF